MPPSSLSKAAISEACNPSRTEQFNIILIAHYNACQLSESGKVKRGAVSVKATQPAAQVEKASVLWLEELL
jgi:hypothetical protein